MASISTSAQVLLKKSIIRLSFLRHLRPQCIHKPPYIHIYSSLKIHLHNILNKCFQNTIQSDISLFIFYSISPTLSTSVTLDPKRASVASLRYALNAPDYFTARGAAVIAKFTFIYDASQGRESATVLRTKTTVDALHRRKA